MRLEGLSVSDEPIEVEVGGRTCIWAPVRMEWAFNDASGPERPAAADVPVDLAGCGAPVLEVLLTERCSLACGVCPNFIRPHPPVRRELTERDLGVIEREIAALPPAGRLVLRGGDPLKRPEAVLRLAAAARCRTEVRTTAVLVTRRLARRLRRAGAVVVVGFDGPVHQAVLGQRRLAADEPASEVLRGLRLLADEGVILRVAVTLSAHNADVIDEVVERVHTEYRPDGLEVRVRHRAPAGAAVPLDESTVAAAFLRLLEVVRRHGIEISPISEVLSSLVSGTPRVCGCPAVLGKRAWLPGPMVVACAEAPEQPVGGWEGRLPVLASSCAGCVARGVCGGGCLADAEGGEGFDGRHCAAMRAVVGAVLQVCARRPELDRTNRPALARALERPESDAAAARSRELRRPPADVSGARPTWLGWLR